MYFLNDVTLSDLIGSGSGRGRGTSNANSQRELTSPPAKGDCTGRIGASAKNRNALWATTSGDTANSKRLGASG